MMNGASMMAGMGWSGILASRAPTASRTASNDLQIGSAIVTVQHHHQMQSVPCLSPGETVTLMPFEQYEAQL